MPHDLPHDEIRRQLRAVDRANAEAMPHWREVLTRIMSGDEQMTPDDKAALLGVPSPSRRQLFKFGGAAIIGAAVLAACGDDKPDATATTSGAAAPTTAGAATTNGSMTGSSAATTMAP